MKRMIFIFSFALVSLATTYSQNWFLGGDVNIYQNSMENDYHVNEKISIIELSPEFGFILTEKLDLGINPIVKLVSHSFVSGNWWQNVNPNTFGISLFTRYSFFEIGKFSMLGRLGLDYIFLDMVGLNISPIFQYKLLDNLYLFTGIEKLFEISYVFSSNYNYNNNGFKFNLSTNNIPISLGNISIGFYVLFDSTGKSKKLNNPIENGNENEKINSNENSNSDDDWW